MRSVKYMVEFFGDIADNDDRVWHASSSCPGLYETREDAEATIGLLVRARGAYTYPRRWRVVEVNSPLESAKQREAKEANVLGLNPAQLMAAKVGAFEIDKSCPLTEGCLDYFPNALAAIASHSKYGNDKYNAGQPMHWAFNKSTQHADSAARHLVKRGTTDPETGKSHTIGLAWRALALLETELLAQGAKKGRAVT